MVHLGIDFGSRRIGLALSTSGILATPHRVIPNPGDDEAAAQAIAGIAAEMEAERLVLGIPRRMRSDPALEARFAALAERLRQQTCKDVVLWNEAYTTAEAATRRRDRGRSSRSDRTEIDMEAAAVILQSYLDEQTRRTS